MLDQFVDGDDYLEMITGGWLAAREGENEARVRFGVITGRIRVAIFVQTACACIWICGCEL